jgi:hypothetical protein
MIITETVVLRRSSLSVRVFFLICMRPIEKGQCVCLDLTMWSIWIFLVISDRGWRAANTYVVNIYQSLSAAIDTPCLPWSPRKDPLQSP